MTASALVAAAAVAGPLASPANAFPCVVGTDCEVSNETEWRDALTYYSAQSGGPHVVSFANDFTISATSDPDPTYIGAEDLVVLGNGFEVSAATPSVRFLHFNGGAHTPRPSLTIDNVTVSGFAPNDYGALLAFGPVSVVDSAFIDNSATVSVGGAIYSYGSFDLEVQNSTFENNSAISPGGAIYSAGPVYVSGGSVFDSNTTGSSGGAIYAVGNVEFIDSVATGNTSTGSTAGAIFSLANLYSDSSTFTDNAVAPGGFGQGGAIYAFSGGEIEHSTFTNNAAGVATVGGAGGAIHLASGSLDVYDTTFDSNVGGAGVGLNGGAGAISTASGSDLYLANSTLTGNRASSTGGALYLQGDAIIDNSTFNGNTARANAAAISVVGSPSPITVDIYQSTLVDNTNDSGGAQMQVIFEDTVLTIAGSVLLGGEGTNNCSITLAAAATDGDNYVDDSTCFTLDASDTLGDTASAMLGELAFNGGPTQTMLPAAGSPLIDANDGGSCWAETIDQRGVMRFQGDACDIGAVEVLELVPFTVNTSNGVINGFLTNAEGVDNIVWTAAADVTPLPPAGVSLPFGIFSFEVPVTAPGWPVWVELQLPSPVNQFWKLQNGTWSAHPGAVITGTTVTYPLVDGGIGDEDLTANSVIIDPVGLGILSSFTG
ncbi:MAG: hypothetical protein CVT64_11465 [Actinobacteria bacterium HGW-Actinobacteria-4]|nr:MAG: hypothetical protein CVT64_11465 [Actinobacteria bacterium HGW-Actinobacteria-4]